MKKRKKVLNRLLSVLLLSTFMYSAGFAGDAPRITKEQVKNLIGAPDVIILDARTGAAWADSKSKIKGAVRVDPADVTSWAGGLPKEAKIIVYCS